MYKSKYMKRFFLYPISNFMELKVFVFAYIISNDIHINCTYAEYCNQIILGTEYIFQSTISKFNKDLYFGLRFPRSYLIIFNKCAGVFGNYLNYRNYFTLSDLYIF